MSSGKSLSAAESPEGSTSSPPGPPGDDVDYGLLPNLVGYNLRITYALASQTFARTFGDEELAPIQFAALEFVSRNPRKSQREIARHIGTTPTVLVSPLDKLEKRGLISRVRSADDRRRSRIHLTDAGKEALRKARKRVREVDARLTEALTEDERQTLLELLHKISGRG